MCPIIGSMPLPRLPAADRYRAKPGPPACAASLVCHASACIAWLGITANLPGHQPGWRRRLATARRKKQCPFPFKNSLIYQLGQLRERMIPVDQLRQRLAEQFSCLWPLRLRSHRHSEFARKYSYSNPSLQITTSEIHCLLY